MYVASALVQLSYVLKNLLSEHFFMSQKFSLSSLDDMISLIPK